MTATIRPATEDDLRVLGENLREEDAAEVAAFFPGEDPAELLPARAAELGEMVAGLWDDELVQVAGIEPMAGLLGDDAYLWCLSTHAASHVTHALARHSRRWVQEQLRDWTRLHAYVDTRYDKSLKWLLWIGFEVIRENLPLGRSGEEFHHVTMER